MKTKICILLLLPALSLFAKEWNRSTLTLMNVSYINIFGKTNVNSFKFYFNSTYESPSKENDSSSIAAIQNSRLNIPVRKLHTDNRYMYADFLTLLKEPQYPEISIAIDESSVNIEDLDARIMSSVVYITIAGVTRHYRIQCRSNESAEGILLEGNVEIKLTDFNLQPPTKMFGLVKVKDEININFGILLGEPAENEVSYDN